MKARRSLCHGTGTNCYEQWSETESLLVPSGLPIHGQLLSEYGQSASMFNESSSSIVPNPEQLCAIGRSSTYMCTYGEDPMVLLPIGCREDPALREIGPFGFDLLSPTSIGGAS